MLEPTPLPPGSSYATVADIRDTTDLPRMPITPAIRYSDGTLEPLWTRPDGSALTLLVRALTFEERRLVNGQSDASNDEITLLTVFYGCLEPKFDTIDQARAILGCRHPAAVDQIAAVIWQLCDLPAALVEREVRRLAGLPPEPRKRPRRPPHVARGMDATPEPAIPVAAHGLGAHEPGLAAS